MSVDWVDLTVSNLKQINDREGLHFTVLGSEPFVPSANTQLGAVPAHGLPFTLKMEFAMPSGMFVEDLSV